MRTVAGEMFLRPRPLYDRGLAVYITAADDVRDVLDAGGVEVGIGDYLRPGPFVLHALVVLKVDKPLFLHVERDVPLRATPCDRSVAKGIQTD